MEQLKFFADLLVVIVLYKRKPQEAPAFVSIHQIFTSLRIFPTVYIHDNSPFPSPLIAAHVIYNHNPKNGGVSSAYNKAFQHATNKSKNWMLLLDQDTIVDTILFEKYMEGMNRYPGEVAFVPKIRDEVALLSPFKFVFGKARRFVADHDQYALQMFRFINSGLLVKCDAFGKAGGYDETIPLDFSDIAFGEALKNVASHFIVVNVTLNHSFSSNTPMTLLEANERFDYFCQGAFVMGQKFGQSYLYYLYAFLRAGRLGLYFRTVSFFRIYFQRAFYG